VQDNSTRQGTRRVLVAWCNLW